jgi:uncharacterized protein (TIGR00645 family)
MAKKPFLESALEGGLFASRWLMAPFYVGLVVALGILLLAFANKLAQALPNALRMDDAEAIMLALSLIDMSLAGNLILIVIFAGYENFVSKLNTGGHEDRPEWMGRVDFSGLKMKLIASIVAISAVALLRAFMEMVRGDGIDQSRLRWLLIVHLTFVISAVLLAVMDYITARTPKH